MADPTLRISGIYVIRCLPNGRVYVGSAANIWQRWRNHRKALPRGKHHSYLFQRCWDKYGESAFLWEVLEKVENNNLLIEREQYWIDALNACHPKKGMNILPKAGSPLGHRLSASTKAKMSVALKGRVFSEEHKAAIAAAKFGKPLAPEHAAKARIANLGRVFGADVRQHMREGQTGRKHSDGTREKMSKASKGKPKAPDAVAKQRAALLAQRDELSLAAKSRWANVSNEKRAERMAHLQNWTPEQLAAKGRKISEALQRKKIAKAAAQPSLLAAD